MHIKLASYQRAKLKEAFRRDVDQQPTKLEDGWSAITLMQLVAKLGVQP